MHTYINMHKHAKIHPRIIETHRNTHRSPGEELGTNAATSRLHAHTHTGYIHTPVCMHAFTPNHPSVPAPTTSPSSPPIHLSLLSREACTVIFLHHHLSLIFCLPI
ncbi:hypothetical protein ILYODFUR_011862 [Ilyodon furcidens]|uniref:Uncharacterized protein n=1 Tax=Ilyodon furcidens TaxID=33524 RepID=A0ABV0TJ35_9TELE